MTLLLTLGLVVLLLGLVVTAVVLAKPRAPERPEIPDIPADRVQAHPGSDRDYLRRVARRGERFR
jgi:hypothetical protein